MFEACFITVLHLFSHSRLVYVVLSNKGIKYIVKYEINLSEHSCFLPMFPDQLLYSVIIIDENHYENKTQGEINQNYPLSF